MTEPDRDEFNVVVFHRNGFHRYILRDVDGKTAVETAKQLTDAIEAREAYVRGVYKIMITDGGDNANFLWEVGKGIVFPTNEEMRR